MYPRPRLFGIYGMSAGLGFHEAFGEGKTGPCRVVKQTSPDNEVRALRATVIPQTSKKLIQYNVSDPFDSFLGLVELDSCKMELV